MAEIGRAPMALDLTPVYAGDTMWQLVRLSLPNGDPFTDVNNIGTFAAQIRISAEDDTEVETIDVITDHDDGALVLTMSPTKTSGLITLPETSWAGVWDLQWTRDTDDVLTLFRGIIMATLDVTRLA